MDEKQLLNEILDELKFKWKNQGYYVYVEKKNHISTLQATYWKYKVAYDFWKNFRNEYRWILKLKFRGDL